MIGRIGSACGWMAVALVGLICPSAAAQQITEATCWAQSRIGQGGWTTAYVPLATGSADSPIDITFVCAPLAAHIEMAQTDSVVTVRYESGSYMYMSLHFQAGAAGAVLLNPRGGVTYRYGAETWAPGTTVVLAPDESREFEVMNLQTEFAVEVASGSIGSFGVDGLLDMPPWSMVCAGVRPWSITHAQLECPQSQCADGSSSILTLSADSSEIEAFARASASPAAIDFGSEFHLSEAALVRYTQDGGAYCDGYPLLDGQLFPAPNGSIACSGLQGFLNLSSGWHSVSAREWDFGDGSFSLTIVGPPGSDCDGNGMLDITEIAWFHWYQYPDAQSDPDTDGNNELDACQRARGDLDLSGSVGPTDLAMLLAAWGQGQSVADMNRDGVVNALDLAALLSNWDRTS